MKRLSTFLAAVCFTAAAANAQTTVDVPIEQASGIATRALLSGEPALALQIARAVLAQRPDDRAALLVVAAAAPQLGDATAGREAGFRAWNLSQTDAQQYEAARLTALAAVNEERFTLATIWLRIALINAPSDAERARTTRDARSVAQRNPWSTQFSYALVPSSNVNGGAEDAESTAPGNPTGTLSVDALALAGWRATLNFRTQYRFQESEKSRSTVALQYQNQRIDLTEDTQVPDAAFDTDSLQLTLRHERALENGTIGAQVAFATYEYRDLDLGSGATDYDKYDTARLQFDRRMSLTDRSILSLSASREVLRYQAAGIGDVNRASMGAGVTYARANNDRISVNYRATDSDGDIDNYTSFDQTLSVAYSWAEPFGPIALSVNAGYKWVDYPNYRLLAAVTGGRQDETVFVGMNVGFPQINYAGFSPGLRIDLSDASSNVSRFDRQTYSVGLTINSSF